MSDFARLQNCDDFGTSDPREPMTERARIMTARLARYSRIMRWAMARYTRDGNLCTVRNGKPTVYTLIERAAWKRYAA